MVNKLIKQGGSNTATALKNKRKKVKFIKADVKNPHPPFKIVKNILHL